MLINLDYLKLKYRLDINGIIHIGAHELEEKWIYNKLGINKIIWIESNQSLVNRFKDSGENIYCATISDKDNEEKEFILTNNIQSSSILELKTHKTEHPHVYEISRYKVKTKTLDKLISENNIDSSEFNFLNIDIQGAELLALKGAVNTLKNMKYLYLEVNEKELYEGCAMINDIDEYLNSFGFKRVETKMTHHGWGDAFYILN
jgi:FkbM family methyltransferase